MPQQPVPRLLSPTLRQALPPRRALDPMFHVEHARAAARHADGWPTGEGRPPDRVLKVLPLLGCRADLRAREFARTLPTGTPAGTSRCCGVDSRTAASAGGEACVTPWRTTRRCRDSGERCTGMRAGTNRRGMGSTDRDLAIRGRHRSQARGRPRGRLGASPFAQTVCGEVSQSGGTAV